MISFGPVVDDGVSSRREREEICFSKRVTFEFREVFRKLTSASARASLGPKEPPQWGLQYSLLACPCAGLCAASADVPAIGTAVHLDLEPTLPTIRHGRRPEPVLRILRLPSDRYGARPPEILGSFVNRAEPTHFSARSTSEIWC